PSRRHRPRLPSFPTRRSSDLAANGRLMRSPISLRNVSMASKTALHSQARTKALFDEEHQFIAPGLQTIALLSELAIDHGRGATLDRKSTRLNSSHRTISYAVF